MKKRLALVLVGGIVSAMAFAGAHADEPSKACTDTSTPVSGEQTANGVRICVNTGTIDGSVTAAGDPTTQSGYVVADGNSTNPDPLDGYLGVENGNPNDADPAIVGCNSGNYNPAGANHEILSLGNPTPPDPADPCFPQPPADR
jgi:hypothetical protein